MRVLVQKVNHAAVRVAGTLVASIEKGYLLLVGIAHTDTISDVEKLAKKVARLRIFPDSDGKMNQDISEQNGAILSVSQFTLYGDASEGNRPSFTAAAKPEVAKPLFEAFNRLLNETYGLSVQTGVFREHMLVELENDGPVTILVESR